MLDAAAAPWTAPRPTFSVVVPLFNEQAGLAEFHRRLAAVMDKLGSWEVVYVNDGSTDATLALAQALRRGEPRVAIVSLSRNFGKEIATTAGLDHARGEAVIVVDADLQDPPELIPALVAGWREGFDTVYAQRSARAGDSLLRRLTAALFYRVLGRLAEVDIPPDVGDFRLMSRRVVDAVLRMREHHRCMKGLFAWVGYPVKAVPYARAPRHAGRSGWTYLGLWELALEGITGCTVAPLKVATYAGLAVALFASVFGAQLIARTLLFGNPVAGYPSLMTVILFLGGVQLLTLGVIGEYLGRVFNETKNRPLYLVERHLPSGVAVTPSFHPSPRPPPASGGGVVSPSPLPHGSGQRPAQGQALREGVGGGVGSR
ncbi:MAG: glycosyltransferase family 2 protein [Acetobacteraceae bacterium]|nr:glycosyltransferase family 2 protein [Acetobacteraceae bacterium]